MMMSLFSVFDPCVNGFQMQWLFLLFVGLLFVKYYYSINGGMKEVLGGFILSVNKSLSDVVLDSSKGLVIFSTGLFLFVFYSNFFGLFSFVFCISSHLSFTLGLGLVLWLSCFLMGWVTNFVTSSAHLVPLGSPLVLAPLLVCVEMISHVIRPITLSVRLCANMTAGHLIVGLLSSISVGGYFSFMVSLVLQFCIMILECAVSFIQGLVFSILFLLYAVEYY